LLFTRCFRLSYTPLQGRDCFSVMVNLLLQTKKRHVFDEPQSRFFFLLVFSLCLANPPIRLLQIASISCGPGTPSRKQPLTPQPLRRTSPFSTPLICAHPPLRVPKFNTQAPIKSLSVLFSPWRCRPSDLRMILFRKGIFLRPLNRSIPRQLKGDNPRQHLYLF